MTPKERPIIYSEEMIRAKQKGLKTMTRRTRGLEKINEDPNHWEYGAVNYRDEHIFYCKDDDCKKHDGMLIKCPYGVPRDRLWTREIHTFCPKDFKESNGIIYRADNKYNEFVPSHEWRRAIHMFRKNSRFLDEIISIRAERVQDISEEDAKAEGAIKARPYRTDGTGFLDDPNGTYKAGFQSIWLNIHGPDAWVRNDWEWSIEFKQVN